MNDRGPTLSPAAVMLHEAADAILLQDKAEKVLAGIMRPDSNR